MHGKIATALVAALLILAGCTGAPASGTVDSGATDTGTDSGSDTTTGTVEFYISDERNAIGDFRHMNVTISKVGFKRAGENGSWQEFAVDNRTVDLTELQGENATLLEAYDLPAGNYTKVFVHVSDTEGILTDGSETNLKLPSNKLQLQSDFTLSANDSVEFVFDISVVKAGNSGKYILKPVINQSGTDVDFEESEMDDEEDEETEMDDDEEDEETEMDDEEDEETEMDDEEDEETEMDDEEENETETDEGTEMDGDETTDTGDNVTTTQGRVDFYVSDEQNAIGDFRHMNVTITEVGFQSGGENGNWTEFAVDNRSADLTELQGANATLLNSYNLSTGNYSKVFVYVGETEGILTDGSETNLKLPSNKLQLNEGFTLSANDSVEFVFDISVVKAGNSGKYILKPVVSESGTDVDIEDVDEDNETEMEDDADENETELDDNETELDDNETDVDENETDSDGNETSTDETTANETALSVSLVTENVTRGENATVEVTSNGTAVENATVTVDGTEAGTTGADGRLEFEVPTGIDTLTVEAEYDGAEAETEVEFEDG